MRRGLPKCRPSALRHPSGVATLTVDRGASLRALSRFCSDLIEVPERGDTETTLADVLVEHGVDTIALRMAYRSVKSILWQPPEPTVTSRI